MTEPCSRRTLLKGVCLAAGALWAGRVGAGGPQPSGPGPGPPGLGPWVGRGLQYRASCPIVGELASGELRLQRVEGTSQYVATLETELRGVVGLLSLQRSDLFVSLMEWSSGRGRFLPIWHGDQASRQGKWRRKVLVFHRDRDEYWELKLGPDKGRERRRRMEGRLLDDPLSAFFNWRVGAFGTVGDDRGYEIDTLARKEPLVVRFRISSRGEADGARPSGPDARQKVHLLRGRLEQELQEAIRGDVEGWLDEDWVPIEARANRVRLVGEVTAYLVQRRQLPAPELSAPPPPPTEPGLWRL